MIARISPLLLCIALPACAQDPGKHPPADGPAPSKAAPLDWTNLESKVLRNHVQLTSRDRFIKAGEAYFSPDGDWIVFQATEVPKEGEDADPFYAMYVAKVENDAKGRAKGLDEITRVSPPHTANTCGWFHPTEASMVLFGSTVTRPHDEGKSGFQVGTRKYVWMFPGEMEVVEAGAFEVRSRRRVQVSSPAAVKPVFTRPNYDAECSYSKDGRFILYAHIEDVPKDLPEGAPHKPDANIYVFDSKTQKHHPIVVAPGYDGGPFFSPDGKSICYRSDRQGNDLLQIFVADLKFETDADGTQVPVGVEREYQLTNNENVNWCPYWHPSGQFLVYATSEVSHSNYEVFAIEVDRAKLTRLAQSTPAGKTVMATDARKARVTQADGADVLPVFSFDGKRMMWTAQRGPLAPGETKPSSQLWMADFVGSPFETKGQ